MGRNGVGAGALAGASASVFRSPHPDTANNARAAGKNRINLLSPFITAFSLMAF